MSEFQVVWSGSDRDVYLCIPGLTTRTMVDASPLPNSSRRAVADVLPTCREQAMSIGEIQARSGASYGVASQALFRLRQDGRLGSDTLPARGSGRRPCVYWRLA